jgi:hypothetical protein
MLLAFRQFDNDLNKQILGVPSDQRMQNLFPDIKSTKKGLSGQILPLLTLDTMQIFHLGINQIKSLSTNKTEATCQIGKIISKKIRKH